MERFFHRLGDLVVRRRRLMLAAWLVLLIAGLVLAPRLRSVFEREQATEGAGDALAAQDIVRDEFGYGGTLFSLILVMRGVPPRAAPADRTPPHRGLGLVSTRSFAWALSSVALGNVAFYSMIVAVPLLLERATDWSSARVGLALAALTGPAILAAPLGGRIADRAGRRAPAVAGHALVAVSLLPVALAPDGRAALIVGSLAAAGVGVGLAHAALQTAAVEAAVSERAGTAAGLYSTCRYVGSIAGALLFAALIGRGLEGFGTLFAVAAGAAACAALVAAGVAPTPARHPLDAAPREEEGTGAPPADGVK